MAFLLEADRLKMVLRGNSIGEGSRRENSAEHSWHVAVMAMVLSEYSPHPVDIRRVLELLIVHDLVEVYAGDTMIYDSVALATQYEREAVAANKLFSILPPDQSSSFRALWQEFEAKMSPESKFARAVDALAPTWLHWGDHANPTPGSLSASHAIAMKSDLLKPFPELHDFLHQVLASALDRGLISA